MWLKTVLFSILLMLILFGCKPHPPQEILKNECPVVDCELNGYVKVEEVNQIIDLTNDLVDEVNICYAGNEDTQLEHLSNYLVVSE